LDKAVVDEKNIIVQIETYIRQGGGEYGEWYIGLADNPIEPATDSFRNHKVKNSWFTYIETSSHEIARAIAEYFINTCGTDGNINDLGLSDSCQSLYVYKKTEISIAPEHSLPVQSIANRSSNLSSQESLSS
jgi:hypothetical protein